MLRWRLTLGTLLIAALVGLCWLDAHSATPGAWLLPAALLCGALASQEIVGLLSMGGQRPIGWIVHAGNVLILVASGAILFWPQVVAGPLGRFGGPALALAASLIAALTIEVVRYQSPGAALSRVALAACSLMYVGVLWSFVIQLRLLGLPGDPLLGIVAIASLIAVVKCNDTGTFTVGRLWGRHKLVPRLSPGKTVEGAIGGLAGGCLGSWFVFEFLAPAALGPPTHQGWPLGWLIFGLLVGVTGMIGDLAESLIKREASRKDSSTWLPGFGGVLDLLDSILLAAPIAYLCWTLEMVGH